MRLKKLSLKDFGCFADQEFEFEPGLNVIVGPNGSGKSTVLDAIYFALYCDNIDRNAYTRYGSARAEIALEIESEGVEYKILRRFFVENSRTVAYLSISGNRPSISGLTRVKDYLFENVYHLPAGALPWYLRQGEINRFAAAFDTEVVDLLRFLGFGKLSPIRQSLEGYLRERFGPVEQKHIEAKTNLSVIQSQIEAVTAELAELDRQKIFDKKREVSKNINQLEELLELYQVYNRFYNFQNRYKDSLFKKNYFENSIAEITKNLNNLEKSLYAIRCKLVGDKNPDSVTDENVLQIFANLEAQKSLYDKTVTDYYQIVNSYFAHFRKRSAPCKHLLEQIRSELTILKNKLDQYSQLGILNSSFEGGRCPFCGSEISNEHLAEMRSEYNRGKERLQELTALLNQKSVQQTYRNGIRKQCRELYRLKNFLKSQLVSFNPESFTHLSLKSEFLNYYQSKQDLQNRLESLKHSLKDLLEEIKLIENSLATFSGYDFSVIDPTVTVEQIQSDLNNLYRQHAELSQKEARYTQLKTQIEELRQLETSLQRHAEKTERDVRHKRLAKNLVVEMENQAPVIAAEYIQQVILPAINVFLHELRSPFLLRYRSVFYVEFDDGRELPVNRLSYGQKTVLSIVAAYAFYINSLSRSVLLADEPLANLDADNSDAIVKFLNRLHDYSLDKQIQCIISSHQISDLAGCSYHIISL